MKYNDILKKIQNDETISSIIRNSELNKLKRLIFFIVGMCCVVILSGLILKFKISGWIISTLFAILISVSVVCYYKFSKKSFVIGKIQRIDHDNSLGITKGTGGFGLNAGVYTTIKSNHVLDIKIATTDNTTEEAYSIVCPPQYERVLKIGDIILHHPYLSYPATLSNKSKCICMKCGTMQSTENSTCFECKTTLFNINS
ncbi:MAG: hypothetical protein E7617_03840 [Ruminococcaceae bacterium]|nr:hypothetical protein [Oscillospiraceae bacterium]